jgi:hypothetical protein
MKNYTRIVFINTGNYNIENYREQTQAAANALDLHYEEITGSNRLVQKLLTGPWDDEFVVVPPGQAITYMDFKGN